MQNGVTTLHRRMAPARKLKANTKRQISRAAVGDTSARAIKSRALILKLLLEGLKPPTIAEKLILSRQRVWVICKEELKALKQETLDDAATWRALLAAEYMEQLGRAQQLRESTNRPFPIALIQPHFKVAHLLLPRGPRHLQPAPGFVFGEHNVRSDPAYNLSTGLYARDFHVRSPCLRRMPNKRPPSARRRAWDAHSGPDGARVWSTVREGADFSAALPATAARGH